MGTSQSKKAGNPGRGTPRLKELAADFRTRLRRWQTWLNIGLLWVTLEIAVLSIERAHWINPQPSLTLVLSLAVAVSGLLVWSRLPGLVSHLLGLVAGGLVTAWQVYLTLPKATGAAGLTQLLEVIRNSWQPAASPLPGAETAGFVLFIVFLTWVVGYAATWYLLRRQNAWVGACLGTVVVLVNLSNLPSRYFFFFGLYFFAAIFLIVQTRIARWQHLSLPGSSYPRRFWMYLTVSLLCTVIVAGSIAWVMPQARISQLQTMIAARTLWKRNIEESSLNFFSTVPSKQPLSTTNTLQDLEFGEGWHRGDQVDFIVRSDQPSYWQVHVYDTYTANGWENSAVSDYVLGQGEPLGGASPVSGRNAITYSVETQIKTDILLNGGSFISADMPALVRVSSGDIVGISSPRVLASGERYSVTATIAENNPGGLAGASMDYPPNMSPDYLRLPPDFPDRIRRLAASVTSAAVSPYDKVVAIDRYLSRLSYNLDAKAAPAGRDTVEYFLTTQKSGFCVHFASAMAVMLRSVGVPTRLAVGYLPGEPGENPGEYLLRDKFYHAWPQVYFPGYGWVDVEATPGGSESPSSEVPIETPWISGDTIASLPQWDIWQTLGIYGITPPPADGTTPPAAEETPEFRLGPVPFADELGRGLLIVIGGFLAILLIVIADQRVALALDKLFGLVGVMRHERPPWSTPGCAASPR